MANTKGDATKTDAAPESTWGASAEAKEAWAKKYGRAAEKRAAEEADKEAK